MTRLAIFALVAILPAAPSLAAQEDSASLHATLRGWSSEMWLRLLDRSAAVGGGRLNPRGTLQRFHSDMDAEYELDVISSAFGLTDEYAWHQRASGARFWAGSVNYERLIAGANLKAAVPLGRNWSALLRVDHEDLPTLLRNRITLRFEKAWRGPFAYIEGSLLAYKPENDIAVGAGWRGPAGEAALSLTVLDAASDIVYQVLEVWPEYADTALDYERQPIAIRATFERSLGSKVRVEGDAGIMIPSRIRAYRQLSPDEGVRLEEEFALAGGLIEWSISPRARVGGFANYVRALTDRTPLPLGDPQEDYRQVERTSSAGVFVVAQPARRWRVEAWMARTGRPESRDYVLAGLPDVDYADRTWMGQAQLGYRAAGSFGLNGALEWDLRKVLRGDRQVPSAESADQQNARVRFDFGWRLADRFEVLLGFRTDLDGDGGNKRFDGAHGRFVMYW